MFQSRDYLLAFAVRYEGDFNLIYQHIKDKEKESDEFILECKEKYKDRFITILDDNYPIFFKHVQKPPFVIFYKGNVDLLNKQKMISVVGTRLPNEYGISMTKKLVKGLVEENFVIVSGIAKGIDATAHKTAIENLGMTIGVVANGVDVYYPSINKSLYQEIVDNGGLIISEYPDSTSPRQENFNMRNRLIAALSKGVLITQAALRSGTLLTVKHALFLGKDIFCVPDLATSGSSCNMLIKQGAKLVENVNDIVDEYY